MKTQFMDCNDINCLSEFDPAPFIYSIFLRFILKENMNTKKVLGSIRANNLRRAWNNLMLRKLCAH